MRGITRPCRHTLDPEMKKQWMSHLCGLCLTLRDEVGHGARALTGYDLILLSVLVEAQAGRVPTVGAGPCPLRGMKTAAVVPTTAPGARLAAASSLLAGAAAIEDKVVDGDLVSWAQPVAVRWAARAGQHGRRLGEESGLDGDLLSRSVRSAAAAESHSASLEDLLAASGEAVGELFAHTAVVAGVPANEEPLRRAGEAFGRLVHLLDAVDDYAADVEHGRFNPLAATLTSPEQARRSALGLVGAVREAMGETVMVEPELANTLLGPVLERSVRRSFRPAEGAEGPAQVDSRWAGLRAGAGAIAAVTAAVTVTAGIFGGRRRPRYYDPYGPPPGYGGYGYGRRGPSCCDLLACDCCANMACNDCCGGGGDDCCVCCC